MKTKEQIISFMESLAHTRTTEDRLNKLLSEFFGVDIKVERGNEVWSDIVYMFDGCDGVFDIYALPMLRPSELDGSDIYITEVNYEFTN